jgi:CMP-2-keto-3-deoxyoctulosonic acid synthetase
MTKKEFLQKYLTYSTLDLEKAERTCEQLNALLTDCCIAVEMGFTGYGFTFCRDNK